MTVKNLADTSFDQLMECFLAAFENYYLKMPTDREYYWQRWKAAKVDYGLSYGMFDGHKLVGFIIHAVDTRRGLRTAFNTGTGVIPDYRRRGILKSIYQHAISELQDLGIEKSSLEVITINEKAVRAYVGVGFRICKKYKCFAGRIGIQADSDPVIKEIPMAEVKWQELPNQELYCWDHQKETLLGGAYSFYQLIHQGRVESFFTINPQTARLSQFDVLNGEKAAWARLFHAIGKVKREVKILNVDNSLEGKLAAIQASGLKPTVDQYEMELDLKGL
ncbi:MAG: GNAT family N-acetyltransferase [Bacteroidia bacterium]|nr:GNAT family N-acetyltransferase [Bacteroidia bacterium]